jgi:hypothetical protein
MAPSLKPGTWRKFQDKEAGRNLETGIFSGKRTKRIGSLCRESAWIGIMLLRLGVQSSPVCIPIEREHKSIDEFIAGARIARSAVRQPRSSLGALRSAVSNAWLTIAF